MFLAPECCYIVYFIFLVYCTVGDMQTISGKPCVIFFLLVIISFFFVVSKLLVQGVNTLYWE